MVDLVLRGGAIALNLLLAFQFIRTKPIGIGTLSGCLLTLGVASYVVLSAPASPELGFFRLLPLLLAVLNPVFLWWFALALFRDDFVWKPVHALPAAFLLGALLLRVLGEATLESVQTVLHQTMLLALLAHIVWMAIQDLRNDLVNSRRRFRIAIAIVLPIAAAIVAAGEIYALFAPLPGWTTLAQAVMLFALSFVFAVWLTPRRVDMFDAPARPGVINATDLSAAERIELERLKRIVAEGVLLEPDLSLSRLAGRLGLPEHRLRRLINVGLGFRSFSAFINEHRVDEARRRLADPNRVREQIVSIAFGVGYASLAPFNRAFRDRTGTTPSQFRKDALGRLVDSENL